MCEYNIITDTIDYVPRIGTCPLIGDNWAVLALQEVSAI